MKITPDKAYKPTWDEMAGQPRPPRSEVEPLTTPTEHEAAEILSKLSDADRIGLLRMLGVEPHWRKPERLAQLVKHFLK